MATVYPVLLKANSADLLGSAFPQPVKVNGTNFPLYRLLYDATADEWAYWTFRMVNYGSGNITIDIDWYAVNATSGNVVWQARIAAITPDTDTQDIETDSLATANNVTDSHLETTGKRLHRCTITLSNLDSVANGDWVVLAIGRNGSSGSDTMANDAAFIQAQLSWSDT